MLGKNNLSWVFKSDEEILYHESAIRSIFKSLFDGPTEKAQARAFSGATD